MSLIATAYLINIIVFGSVFLINKNNKYLIANNFLLACFAVVEILVFLWELFIAWYGGYLPETIAFYNRSLGSTFTAFVVLGLISWIVPFINFSRKYRKKWIVQAVIILLFFVPGFMKTSNFLNIFGIRTVEALPGWHTMIYEINYPGYITLVLVFLILNLILVYFKILPEFRANSKDDLYDSLIDD